MTGRSSHSPVSVAACVAVALVATACNRVGTTTGPTNISGKDFAANLRLVSGDQQIAALGSAVRDPIVVKVVDAGGQPVQGATVSFSVRAGGGSISPAANVSNAAGIVSSTWTMGTTLGANKAVAILTNNFVLDSTVFTATAKVGAAALFTKVSGDAQTGVVGTQPGAALIVKVQDARGNAASGVPVTWSASSDGSFSAASDTTAADGTASATWKLGTIVAIPQRLTAVIAGVPTILTFTATATPQATRILKFIASTPTPLPAAGLVSTLLGTITVSVTDSLLNPISGAAITWNDSIAGGGTLAANSSVTSAAGTATNTWTLGRRPGEQYLRVLLAGRPDTVRFTTNATAALTDVNAGNFSSCALAVDGTAMCWGYGADGQLGKLANRRNSNAITTSVSPTDSLLGPFLTFRQINVGKNHSCGVTIGRDVFCWGTNTLGQTAPAVVAGTPARWKADQSFNVVSAGEFNTCAATPTGVLYCSGANDQGQLGNGVVVAIVTTPTVSGTAGAGAGALYSTLAVGQAHVCAMERFNTATALTTTSSRQPICWGYNTSGQVGGGAATLAPSLPVRVTPTVVGTVFDSTSLVAGNAHTCAIATAAVVPAIGTPVSGAAWCWGSNGSGQLGIATGITASPVSSATPVNGGLLFAQLSAGAFHTCGLTPTGAAFCWGANGSAQLGIGLGATAGIGPVTQVTFPAGVTSWRSISAGELFTCAVAGTVASGTGTTTTPGAVYCWGDNEYGQIGRGLFGANNAPVTTPTRLAFTNP